MHEFLVDQKLVVRRPDVGHPNFHTVGPVVDQVAKFHGEILTRTSLFATQVFLSEFPSQSSESGLTGSVETNEMVHPLHSEVTQYERSRQEMSSPTWNAQATRHNLFIPYDELRPFSKANTTGRLSDSVNFVLCVKLLTRAVRFKEDSATRPSFKFMC